MVRGGVVLPVLPKAGKASEEDPSCGDGGECRLQERTVDEET